ncbi:MAG: NeuD/PglB/VioB family sugar acetyltransferase [Rhodospirillaceae bacterium]
MTRPVVLLGAGGHARVIAAALRASGHDIAAVAAPEAADTLARTLGVRAMADDEAVFALDPGRVELVVAVGMLSPSPLRRRLFDRFRAAGFRFARVVHPRAIVDEDVVLGEGSVVMAGAIVQTGCRIGDNAIINSGGVVDHDCLIGAHAHLATGCVLAGGVQVGEGALIGAGATVIQSLSIGAAALVAAGAVVTRDIASGERVGGVPARPLCV